MKIQTNLKIITAVVTGLAASVAAISTANATTKSVTASVVVDNVIAMTVAAPLDFGKISALGDASASDAQATMVRSANPATAQVTDKQTNSAIIVLTQGSPADIVITGAAADYELDVVVPTTDIFLSNPAVASGSQEFVLDSFNTHAYLEGTTNSSFGTTTTATGALSFYVGASLTTAASNLGGTAIKTAYTDGTYTGTFDVSVNY